MWQTESFLLHEIFLIQKSVSLTVTVAKSPQVTVHVCWAHVVCAAEREKGKCEL